MKKSLV